MNIVLSVVVCTYNREDILPLCLQSLAEQTLDKSFYEVIIVNNNSTDATQLIAELFAEKYDNFRLVLEKRQGLSHARNYGWREARGKYIAYIDDDAVAQSNWVVEIFAFIERHPEVCAFGGPYSAICSVPLPNWLPEGYGSWSLGHIERSVTAVQELPSGTNMVFHSNLLSEIGGFDSSLGMRGGLVGYGEETRFFKEIVERNIPIYYAPNVKVFHRVLTKKLTIRWYLNSHFQTGKCSESALGCSRSLTLHILCTLNSIIIGVRTLLFDESIVCKVRIVKALVSIYSELGGLFEHLFRGKGLK